MVKDGVKFLKHIHENSDKSDGATAQGCCLVITTTGSVISEYSLGVSNTPMITAMILEPVMIAE